MPVWLAVVLVAVLTPAAVVGLVLGVVGLVDWAERARRRPRTQYLVADEPGVSADAARIALALDIIDQALAEQSTLYVEDRDGQLVDTLLEIRALLAPSVVSAVS